MDSVSVSGVGLVDTARQIKRNISLSLSSDFNFKEEEAPAKVNF